MKRNLFMDFHHLQMIKDRIIQADCFTIGLSTYDSPVKTDKAMLSSTLKLSLFPLKTLEQALG